MEGIDIMNKKAENLSENIIKEVQKSIEKYPYGFSEEKVIDDIAKGIDGTRKYRIKDFEFVMSGYNTEQLSLELSLYKTNNEKKKLQIKEKMQLVEIAQRVVEKAKYFRKERNRKTNKVDTNILTHSPFFVGGSRKRKKEAKTNRYVELDKAGLRKLTYQNKQGDLLNTKDARTLLTLFALWEEQGLGNWLTFTEYQLLTRMNMSTGGSSYRVVKESLERLRNTHVILQQAYDVDSRKRTVTERFPLIIADKFTIDEDSSGNVWSKTYDIQFSPYIHKSFNGGYCTLISLAVFDELESDISKAIYLLLSGIKDMDENSEYVLRDGSFEIPLDDLYESLFLEDIRSKNKNTVTRGCTELKDIDIIEEFEFLKSGNKYTKLRIEPSDWFMETLSNRKTFLNIEEKSEQMSLEFNNK